jgi:hypothetical protein
MRVFGSAFDEYNWVTVLMIAALTPGVAARLPS